MRNVRYTYAAAALALVVATTGWIAWHRSGDGQTGTTFPTGAPVDPSAPDYRLLQDVLDITASRAAGDINFSYVPERRPPNLLRMSIGSDSGLITDVYQFGAGKLGALAAFSRRPTDLCTGVAGLCVRDGALAPAPADPAFAHVVVYFSANVSARADSATAAEKQFWANIGFVPLDRAGWFSDLAARAQQASE